MMKGLVKPIKKKAVDMESKDKKCAGILLLAAAFAALLTGCMSAADIPPKDASGDVQASGEDPGTGRYVEKNVLSLDEWGAVSFQGTDDGTLVLVDGWTGGYVSGDKGESWEKESSEWSGQSMESDEGRHVQRTALSADGMAALSYYQGEDGSDVRYLLIRPDGTRTDFDMDLAESVRVTDFCFTPAGRLFASTTDAQLYEIDTADGASHQVTMFEDGVRYLRYCPKDILLCVSGESVFLYDLEAGAFIEDNVLQDFIKKEHTAIRDHGNGWNVYLFGGEENVIYLAGEKGLYRHAIGGSLVEQVIDDGMSSFGDPSHLVDTAAFLEGGEFVVFFSDGKVMKYVYDASIPSVPDSRLAVYSLRENDTIRQAITAYQLDHPEVYISYTIGMEGDGITREDALKKLNMGLMDGSGPDILVLDQMPFDAYMEQGVLMDISSIISELDTSEGLFMGLIDPLAAADGLYMVPAEFRLPLIAGHQDMVQAADGYQGIADAIGAARTRLPDAGLIHKSTASGILKSFLMVCAPSWITEDGELDRDALRAFLEQTKRIYDAQMDGTPQATIDAYLAMEASCIETFGCTYEESTFFDEMDGFDYLTGSIQFAYGTAGNIDDLASILSMARIDGYEDTLVRRMDGQCTNVYFPKTLIGINAASGSQEESVQFLQALLGESVQKMTHYGFPVNKKAFESGLVPEGAVDGAPYMTYGGTDNEGKNLMWDLYHLDGPQQQLLEDLIAQSDTPYLPDMVLEEVVCREGELYLNGSQGLDEAVQAVSDRMSVYLAE